MAGVVKPKAVVLKPKAVVAPPKAVVAPPKAVVAKPKAVLTLPPYEREGVGGAVSPYFPATLEIISASPTTGEVLVRDIETREQSWQPATGRQITDVTEAVRRVEAGERVVYPEYVSKELAKKRAPPVKKVEVPLEVTPLKAKERVFTIDPTWKVGELTAEGLVEWYVDRKGVKHYTPASTMWDLGFKTSTQYLRGKPAPYIGVETPERGVIHITRPEATKLSGLKGADLHHAWISLGIIPKGSEYDPKTRGFFSPEVVKAKKKFEAELKVSSPALYKLYRKEGVEGYNKEVERHLAKLAEFEGELKETFPSLHKIYKEEGIDAYNKEVVRLQREITVYNAKLDATMASLKPFTDKEGGVNLFLAVAGGIPPDDLKLVGFEDKDIDNAIKGVKVSRETQVALPGEKFWQHRLTGKLYTDKEFKQIVADYDAKVATLRKAGKAYTKEWEELGEHPTALVTLSAPSGKRLGIEATAFIIPPARAALPETTIRDISAAEWVLGVVNTALIGAAFAPGAILGSLAGRVGITGLSTAGAGALGYEVGKHWSDLSAPYRAIGVGGVLLYSLPVMATVARGVKIATVRVPAWEESVVPGVKLGGFTPTGEPMSAITWKGLTVFQNPIIGKSGGKWVIGARNITLPEARLMLDGYHPQLMLETKVFVNPKALAKAGISKTQIDYLTDTLKKRNLFAGKQSKFLSKEALIEPTARLDADEIGVLLRQMQKWNKGIKQVDLLYGSPTIKAQLAPELRGWRDVHDWDISMTTSPERTTAFIKETMVELKKLLGNRQYRISPKEPMLIEKKIAGKWQHIADIHSHEVSTALSGKDIPRTALDATGEYSYGRMVAEPAITVKYPGIGKIDIMKLSESGVRKADTILRVRQIKKGTAFRPPERGIARPGVPKDAADYYVTLKTFERSGVLKVGTADDWAREWAKSMGYTEAQLVKLMPTLKKAMLKVASETPSNLIGYRITPASTAKVPAGASPTITIHIPASLGASVSGRLAKSISTPVSPYVALSKIASPSLLPSVAKSVPISKAISPSLKANISTILMSVSPAIKPSPVVKPSPALSPSLASIKPSPAYSPSPKPSPSPAPSPAPSPSPSPFPKPSPIPSPVPVPPIPPIEPPKEPPKVPPPPVMVSAIAEARRKPVPPGSITFAFGRRKGVGGIKVPQWYYIPPPYDQRKPISLPYPPVGAINPDGIKPGKTIQKIGEAEAPVPENISIDLGITDAFITRYGRRITFGGKGEKTDVGTRMPSPTKGMSIPVTEPLYFTDELFKGLPKQGIKRPAMSKKNPKRKGRKDEPPTSVQGIRR